MSDVMTLSITTKADSPLVDAEARFNGDLSQTWKNADKERVLAEFAIVTGIAKIAWGDKFSVTILPEIQEAQS